MSKNVVIVAGGPTENLVDLKKLAQQLTDETIWIGVDRGNLRLMSADIKPHIAVGDFDSLSEAEKKILEEKVTEIHTSIPEKDQTDTELALDIVAEKYPESSKIYLCGATGGRIDHFLSNLWLVFRPCYKKLLPKLVILDRQNTIHFFEPGTYHIAKEVDKKYLAFVCLTPVERLTLQDVRYPLTNQQVDYPLSYASNEFISETAEFSFKKGLLAVIQSND